MGGGILYAIGGGVLCALVRVLCVMGVTLCPLAGCCAQWGGGILCKGGGYWVLCDGAGVTL